MNSEVYIISGNYNKKEKNTIDNLNKITKNIIFAYTLLYI